MNACEILAKAETVAKRSVYVALAFWLLVAATPAKAVNLENHDRQPREVTINRSNGSSETLTLKPGQRLENICTDCVILVGESSVETRGSATVKIEGGEVSIASER